MSDTRKRIVTIAIVIACVVGVAIGITLLNGGMTQSQGNQGADATNAQQAQNQTKPDDTPSNAHNGTTSSTVTESIAPDDSANNTGTSNATGQTNAEPQYTGDKATSDDIALSEAARSYDDDADTKLARDLVSHLYEYTSQSLGADWLSGVMTYVDQNAMASHPNDKNGDNDNHVCDNVLATRTNSAWYEPMSRYDGISSHVESITDGNVFANYNNGTIYPVVRLYVTYTANASTLDTSNDTWKSMNRFYDQVLVWLTPDQSRVFMVTTAKSTVIDYDINHVLTERHILNEDEQRQKALQLSQTMGL